MVEILASSQCVHSLFYVSSFKKISYHKRLEKYQIIIVFVQFSRLFSVDFGTFLNKFKFFSCLYLVNCFFVATFDKKLVILNFIFVKWSNLQFILSPGAQVYPIVSVLKFRRKDEN